MKDGRTHLAHKYARADKVVRRWPAPRVFLGIGELLRCGNVAHLFARLTEADLERFVQDGQNRLPFLSGSRRVAARLKRRKQGLHQAEGAGMSFETFMFKRGNLLSPYWTSPRFCAAQYSFVCLIA